MIIEYQPKRWQAGDKLFASDLTKISTVLDSVENLASKLDHVIDIDQPETLTNYVDTKVADLVNGAPETLDTLKELSDAITQGDDAVKALNKIATANKSSVTKLDNKKADKTDVEALSGVVTANQQQLVEQLDTKASSDDLQAINLIVNDKADKASLEGLATKEEVALKADKEALEDLATKSEVALKADRRDIEQLNANVSKTVEEVVNGVSKTVEQVVNENVSIKQQLEKAQGAINSMTEELKSLREMVVELQGKHSEPEDLPIKEE